MKSRREIAARRHYECHLRVQGNAKSWSVKQSSRASHRQCLKSIPLWRRVLARLGVMP